ncbi:MAG: class I SAM-dependent methyltransferase [Pseudomonadota bacterium]
MSFKDHFSAHAATYQQYRPLYPWRMYRWLASRVGAQPTVWDCATGNGQAAHDWVHYAERVVATDASVAQIQNARAHPRISFAVASAERSGLAPASVDIVSVAQALHWFDQAAFYREADRVLRDDGVLAVWTYQWAHVSSAVDAIVHRFALDTLAEFWPAERAYVDNRYMNILPDWRPLATPQFEVHADWSCAQLLGYLSSWSALQRARRATGADPLAEIAPSLRSAWGAGRRQVRWPLVWHVFRKP